MYFLQDFLQYEEKKHDAAWFNRVCRYTRMYMRPVVDKGLAKQGMDYILGRQSLDFVSNLFINAGELNLTNQNGNNRNRLFNQYNQQIALGAANNNNAPFQREMAGIEYKPLPIMEKLKNILLSDMRKVGINITARCEDPTAKAARQKDKEIVKNRQLIERDLSYLYESIGEKPFVLTDTVTRFGKKAFSGNIEVFDDFGADMNDPSDVNFIFDTHYKLDTEIAVEKSINALFASNRMEDKIDMWALDIVAKKALAYKTYVSKTTGELRVEYVSPETMYVFGGTNRSKNFEDAQAFCVEQMVTLRQALELAGDSFDIQKEWSRILMALQTTNTIEFTGIQKGWQGFMQNGGKMNYRPAGSNDNSYGNVYSYNDLLGLNITMGYMEISSQVEIGDADATTTDNGEYYQDNQPKPKERYQAKARYETPIYCAYYLAISNIDQIIFDFGKVPYQHIEGYQDYVSNFSLGCMVETGDPIGILCIPYIDLINECWYKLKYHVRKAKPPGKDYNMESLIQLSEMLITDVSVAKSEKLNQTMQVLDQAANGFWTFPIGPNGEPLMMTNQVLNPTLPNGLDDKAMIWGRLIAEAKAELMDILGISPLREGDPGSSKDSVSNQFKALEYSIASTQYIGEMLTRLYKGVATRLSLYVQDIVTYKKQGTMAYSYLENLIGKETLDTIESVGQTAMSRMGIFMESLNQAPMRAFLDTVINNGLMSGKIDITQAIILKEIKSYKYAAQMLAYYEERNRRKAQKDAMEQQKAQAEAQQQLAQMQLAQLKMQLDNQVLLQAMKNHADLEGKKINQQGGIAKTILKQNGDVETIYHQARADMEISTNEAKQEVQALGGAIPPPPQNPMQQGYDVQQPQQPGAVGRPPMVAQPGM